MKKSILTIFSFVLVSFAIANSEILYIDNTNKTPDDSSYQNWWCFYLNNLAEDITITRFSPEVVDKDFVGGTVECGIKDSTFNTITNSTFEVESGWEVKNYNCILPEPLKLDKDEFYYLYVHPIDFEWLIIHYSQTSSPYFHRDIIEGFESYGDGCSNSYKERDWTFKVYITEEQTTTTTSSSTTSTTTSTTSTTTITTSTTLEEIITTSTFTTSTLTIQDDCLNKNLINCAISPNCKWVGSRMFGHCEFWEGTQTTTTIQTTTTLYETSTTSTTTIIQGNCLEKSFTNCLLSPNCKWIGSRMFGHCESQVSTTTTTSSSTTTTSFDKGILLEKCSSYISILCPPTSGGCEIHRLSSFGDCTINYDILMKTCDPGKICSEWGSYAYYKVIG